MFKKFFLVIFLILVSFLGDVKKVIAEGTSHDKLYSITCNIGPEKAVLNGAKWRLNIRKDHGWHDSSETIYNLAPGEYKVRFKRIYGWRIPTPMKVKVTNKNVSVSATYQPILSYGSMRIDITPSEAAEAGVEWKIIHGPDNGRWHKSGEVVEKICVGRYKVEFKWVYGWHGPRSIIVEVHENQLSQVTVDYEKITRTGSLVVNIEPVEAMDKGAWKLVNGPDDNWHKTGERLDNICVGKYYVKFKHIYGWKEPRPVKISINELSPTILNVSYVPITKKGSLKINILPEDVVSVGAMWKINLSSDDRWHTTGDIIDDLYVGDYEVDFKPIYGYYSPKLKKVMIKPNTLNEYRVVYVPIKKRGNLKVIISPDSAVSKGAKWRFVSGGHDTKWHDSGEEVKNIAVGDYFIKYKEVEGFVSPQDDIVRIYPNKTTLVEACYKSDSVEQFVVSDVRWSVLRNSFMAYGEIDTIPNGIPVLFSSFHCEDWQLADGSYDCKESTAKLSFRLFSKTSPNQIVKVELYSVNGSTRYPDKLVATLVSGREVVLDEDPERGGYSKYFEDFLEWNGKVNGKLLTPGFYKVKVSTQEGSNWDEEGKYLFSDNFRIIPAKYLRSPFVRPEDALSFTDFDIKLIGLDLENSIISGLYPIYHNHDYNFVIIPSSYKEDKSPPLCKISLTVSKLEEIFEYFGLNKDEADDLISNLLIKEYIDVGVFISSKFLNLSSADEMVLSDKFEPYREEIYNKLSDYYLPYSREHTLWSLFYEIGIPIENINQLIKELDNNGYIKLIKITPVKLKSKFLNLNTYTQLDIADKFARYKSAVFNLLKTAYKLGMPTDYYFDENDNRGWYGHCRWWSDGMPLYEGPIDHGIHPQDFNNYFEGMRGGICHCGEGDYPSECKQDCQYTCSMTDAYPGRYCGNYGHVGHYWVNGEVPLEEDLIGYIYAPIDGKYKFKLYADDAGSLSIGGNLQIYIDRGVDNDSAPKYIPYISDATLLGNANGDNEHMFVSDIDLTKGYYPIKIKFYNGGGPAALQLYWNVVDANNQDFIFTDPTFIQQNKDNTAAFERFLR